MHDIRWIRDNPDAFDAGMAARGLPAAASRLIAVDERRRVAIRHAEELQARTNTASRAIGKAKAGGDEAEAGRLMKEVADLKASRQAAEDDSRGIDEELRRELEVLPNMPFGDVPVGPDETANVVRSEWGSKPALAGPREHFDVGEALGMMDFDAAAKMSGSRFVVLRGELARLSRALGQFMLDLHTAEHGYTETVLPLIVRDRAVYGTGQLPKAGEDMFSLGEDRWLIPTAEVPLANLVRERIVEAADLPIRVTALTPCFRSEAGAAGRDTRGMLRQHQFDKVELVSVTEPDRSKDEHERMLACAEEVMRRLDLHYRVVTLSTGDMSFAAHKTYDIEAWLPGQGTYREISSCSNTGAFQARRMAARYRPEDAKGTDFVHTLNGSGVAIGRALIAIVENYLNPDGTVTVPDVLRPRMGTDVIGR